MRERAPLGASPLTRCELCGVPLTFKQGTERPDHAWFVMDEVTMHDYSHTGWHCKSCKTTISSYQRGVLTQEQCDLLGDRIAMRVMEGSPNPVTDYLKRRRGP